MRKNEKGMEKGENAVNDKLLKEVLCEYAAREPEAFDRERGEDVQEPGVRLNRRMKRTFWYYGGGRKKIFASGCICAAAALLAAGIYGMQARQEQKKDRNITLADSVPQDADNVQYEVYMNHYGEEAVFSYASAQNESRTVGALPEEIAVLPEESWDGFSVHTDTETAIRNSNYQNFGYLCADGEGRIYYSDLTERAVYMSNEDGSGRTKLADGAGNYLQEKDGNLYYTALDEDGAIMRLNIATKEKTVLMDAPHGEFLLTEEGLLINAESGVLLLDYEGGDAWIIEAMSGMDWQPALFTASDGTILFNAVQGTDAGYYLRGYLLCYDKSREEVLYLGQGMMRPLLAGSYLLAIKGESVKEASLHVMDMAAGTDTDLGVWPYDGFVSDGDAVYYTRGGMLGRFRDGVNEEIMNLHEQESELMGQAPERYLYLAGDYLYWLSRRQVTEDGKVTEVFYEWHSTRIAE